MLVNFLSTCGSVAIHSKIADEIRFLGQLRFANKRNVDSAVVLMLDPRTNRGGWKQFTFGPKFIAKDYDSVDSKPLLNEVQIDAHALFSRRVLPIVARFDPGNGNIFFEAWRLEDFFVDRSPRLGSRKDHLSLRERLHFLGDR